MSRTVVFNELWLLSERDASARHLSFHPRRNLLAGSNGTGKSRVLKHLVWALGCEPPKRAAAGFDSNVVAAVDISIGARRQKFVRQNKKRAAFDVDGRLLFATESASEWNTYFADTFDFHLKLQRHDDEGFGLAGPTYALLPFYIDQDGSWGLRWTTFTNLTQFANWQTAVFNSFTGLKPAAYVQNQMQREDAAYRLRMAKAEAKVQHASYERVMAMLPPETTVVDETQFAQQLQNLAEQTRVLQVQQAEVRGDLLQLVQERQQKTSELKTALVTERALVEDLAYLADYPDGAQLVCPTCSHVHLTSFNARQTLAVDAHEIHEVAANLQAGLEKLKSDEAALQEKLIRVSQRLRQLQASLNEEHKGQRAADIVAAKSRNTIEQAYDATRRELVASIDTLAQEKADLDEQLAALTDKGRERRVKDFFGEQLLSFADWLDIDKGEISAKLTVGARPPAASGSYAPRAILATHLALLDAHGQFGTGCTFPFIVDTPQQSGQDPSSLGRMLDAILAQPGSGQRMVATESIPDQWVAPTDCGVLEFTAKRSLLRPEEYRQGISSLSAMVLLMREALTRAEPSDEYEGEGAPPTDDEGGDSDGDADH